MSRKKVNVRGINVGDNITVIAGACSIENRAFLFEIAQFLKKTCSKFNLPLIFKASFDKANRLSIKSFRGPGIKEGLKLLGEVKKKYDLPILTDVSRVSEIKDVKKTADVIQIPAFLSRQTDLLVESAKTQKAINIKKGQFLSPYDMKFLIEKAESAGGKKIMLTERGTSFGYNNLVVDFRSICIMKETGYPVIFDATHSVQLPGAAAGKTTGQKEFCLPLIKAAVAVGCDGIFLEVHPHPEKAKSDRGSVMSFGEFAEIAAHLKRVKRKRTKSALGGSEE